MTPPLEKSLIHLQHTTVVDSFCSDSDTVFEVLVEILGYGPD